MGLIVGRDGDGQVKAVWIARLRQQLFGFGNVLRVVIGQAVVKILAEGGVHAGPDGLSVAVGNEIQNLLLVDGVAQGLPHLLVVQRGRGVVQIQGLHQIHGAFQNGILVSQLGNLSGGQMGAEVHRPALERLHQGVGVFNDFEGHLVQRGGSAPIIVKPFQHNGFLRGAGDKTEGAGAHRRGVLLVVVPGHDGGGEIGQKLVVRLFQLDHNGFAVRGLYRLDIRKRLHQGLFPPRGVGAALNGINHIVRAHRFTIVEFYAVTQSEGVGFSTVGFRIGFSNRGNQISVRRGLYQALKDVEQDLSGSCRHSEVGVKTVVQVLRDGHRDFIAGRRAGRAAALVRSVGPRRLAAVSASAEYSAQKGRQKQE